MQSKSHTNVAPAVAFQNKKHNKPMKSPYIYSVATAITLILAAHAEASQYSPVSDASSVMASDTRSDTALRLAQLTTGPVSLAIPAGNLSDAIQSLARQTNTNILVNPSLVEGLSAPEIKQDLSFDQALAKLLAGTGLAAKHVDNRTVTLVDSLRTSQTDTKGSTGGFEETGSQRKIRLSQTDSNDSTPSESTEGVKLEEIVVTAQKREERLQDVPSSITVLSGQHLEKTSPQSLVDLNGLVPGLAVTSGGMPGRATVTMRGIAPLSVTGALVGTYIDETPVGSSSGQIRGASYSPDLMPYDLEQIEVLSGPQGTLYGAASMGGLLKYSLKDANLTQFSARAGGIANAIDGGSGVGGGVRAAVNIPLVNDVFGVRLSAYDQKTQGYINNILLNDSHYNSFTQKGGRIAGLWQVADTLSIKFSAILQKIDADGPSLIPVDSTTRKPLYGSLSTGTELAETLWQKSQFYSLVTEWEPGFATFVSASSWERDNTNDVTDLTPGLGFLVPIIAGDGQYADNTVPFPAKRTMDKFTQEFRLVSPSEQRFQWMVGTFYTTEDTRNFQAVYALDADGELIPGINPFFAGDVPWDYEEIAAFANGTVRFNDRFSLTAGVRYSKNKQSYTNNVYGALLGSIDPPPPFEFPSTRESVTTWMVSPQWHVSPDTMVYARVATGYRPGGYAFSLPPAPSAYESDTLTNYEIGIKSSLLESRLILNLAVYDIEWKDIQQDVRDPATSLVYIGNGGKARSRGGEVSASYSFANNLRLGTVLGYTDAHLTEDAPTIGGTDGAQLPNSAKVTGALTADYRRPVGSAQLELGGAFRVLGSPWDLVVESAAAARKIDRAQPLDLYAGLDFGRIEARLFLRNALNSTSEVDFVRTPAVLPPGALTYVPEAPRTVGLSVDVSF